jgi:hypothetical protein
MTLAAPRWAMASDHRRRLRGRGLAHGLVAGKDAYRQLVDGGLVDGGFGHGCSVFDDQ